MSLVLQPQASFTVVRQIANHLDTDTNYVQAVIRNAYTDAVIDTLQLTDKGSQRFSKNWQVPGDPSGQGFYISIVTSVYADPDYTTKNPNYGDEESTYLVQERVLAGHGGGGGGVDAYTVRRIIREELAEIPKPEPVEIPPYPEFPAMRWDEVLDSVAKVSDEVHALPPQVDLEPVLSAIKETKSAVEAKEVTPEADLKPLKTELQDGLKKLAKFIQTRDDATAEKTADMLREDVLATLKSMVSETTFSMAPTTMKMNPPEPKAEVPVPFDINQLAT